MRALCVISGGMDSATCAYIAKREGYEIVALHFDYNQRTMGKERECFGKICDDLGVAKRFVLDAHFIAQIGGSALTDGTLPIRKGAAELCAAANSAGTEIDSAVNSKSARLDWQNSIAANSINAEIGEQNFAASNFMMSPADVPLDADSARSSRTQSGEILTQGGEISLQSGAEPQQGDKISSPSDESVFSDLPSTYVPFRNGVFLSIAAALAEKERCDAIFIGVVQEDGSGYPDCGAEFIGAFERALDLGTSRDFHPRIKTPLVHLSKAQIVSLALEIGVPLELTWSCYEREDAACGLCDSCLLRLKGFAGASAKDKIPYAIEA